MAPCGKRRGTPPTVVVRSTSTGRWGTRCRKFDENDHVRPGRSTRWPGKKADSALRLRAAQERQISYRREQTRLATACLSTSLLCRTARARVPGRDVGSRIKKSKGMGIVYAGCGMCWQGVAAGISSLPLGAAQPSLFRRCRGDERGDWRPQPSARRIATCLHAYVASGKVKPAADGDDGGRENG